MDEIAIVVFYNSYDNSVEEYGEDVDHRGNQPVNQDVASQPHAQTSVIVNDKFTDKIDVPKQKLWYGKHSAQVAPS